MQSTYYTFIALQLAQQRTDEANRQRMAALAHPGETRPNVVRRAVARVALAVAVAADERSSRRTLASH